MKQQTKMSDYRLPASGITNSLSLILHHYGTTGGLEATFFDSSDLFKT